MHSVNLIDILYLFDNNTHVEVRNHMDDSIILTGTVDTVISQLNGWDFSYVVDLGAPFNYIVVKGANRIVVYPDWEM